MALGDFRKYFGEFLALVTAGVATTAAVLATALSGFAPPWPSEIIEITAIIQLLILVFVYQFMKRSSKRTVNRRMILSFLVFVVILILYLSAYSLLVYDLPDETRNIRGYFCTDDALTVYGNACPLLTEAHIADSGFNPERLWTAEGTLLSRMTLFLGWMGFFSALVSVFAMFAIYQRR